MKNNSKVLLWLLVGGFSLVGMLVFAENVIEIAGDPANAVQNINAVRIKQVDNVGDDVIITSAGLGLSQIDTNYNILLGTTDNQISGSYATILGGMGNEIIGRYDTIIAGGSNKINTINDLKLNTILGGMGNEIIGNSVYSVIAGGGDNKIEGESSIIVGGKSNEILGNWSAIVGSENSVMGNSSVAMGKKSKVYGNNSFLWKDSDEDATLTGDNIFAVVSRKGMVINSRPNNHAQLTIGGSLIVGLNDNDQSVICEGGEGLGTIRTVLTGERYCLCNCNGDTRNSMFGPGQCQSVCRGESMQPVCGTGLIRRYINHAYTFHGTCEFGEVVGGTGAYLVDRNNIVHWTCQTADGASIECNSAVTGTGEEYDDCELDGQTIPHGSGVMAYLSSHPVGECVSARRQCNDGTLEGNSEYNHVSCSVNGCKKPWNNEYIPNGSNLTAYKDSSVPFGSSCESQVRTCSNGHLDGTYTKQYCTVGSAPKCKFYDGSEYEHLSYLKSYKVDATECPLGCNDDEIILEARCYNGIWVSTNSDYWDPESPDKLIPDINPEEIKVELYPNKTCVSKNSSNANIFTLTVCPQNSVCTSGTVSYGVNEPYPGNSCKTEVKYKLQGCSAGDYWDGSVCKHCPSGYTSEAGAMAKSGCYITCSGGYYLPTAGASSCSSCSTGTYKGSHQVYYGYSSSCANCTNPKPFHSSYSSNASGNNCSYWCDAGYYRNGYDCVACPQPGYTTDTGATSPSDCYKKCEFDGIEYNSGDTINTYLHATESCPTTCQMAIFTCHPDGERYNGNTQGTPSSTCELEDEDPSYKLNGCPPEANCSSRSIYVVHKITGNCTQNPVTRWRIDSCQNSSMHVNSEGTFCCYSSTCTPKSIYGGYSCGSCARPGWYLDGTSCYTTYLSSCFVFGTKVTMADGTKKNIEDVNIGDKLLGQNGVNTVLDLYKPLLNEQGLISINGGNNFVTPAHPFMTTEGWKSLNPEESIKLIDEKVTLLKVGDVLVTENGYEVVRSLAGMSASPSTQLYNFRVDGDNTYYANGYLVHNKDNQEPVCSTLTQTTPTNPGGWSNY